MTQGPSGPHKYNRCTLARLCGVLASSVPMTSSPREPLGTDTQACDGVQPLLSLEARSQKPWSP